MKTAYGPIHGLCRHDDEHREQLLSRINDHAARRWSCCTPPSTGSAIIVRVFDGGFLNSGYCHPAGTIGRIGRPVVKVGLQFSMHWNRFLSRLDS